MSRLNHIPLLRLLIPFIGGIISVVYLKPNTTYLLVSFGIAAVSFLIALGIKLTTNYKYRWIFGVLIYTNLALTGACLTSLKYQKTDSNSNLLTKHNNQLFIGEIIKPTQLKAQTIKAILNIKGIKTQHSWLEIEKKVIVYLEKGSRSNNLGIGDIISFKPKLKDTPPPKNPNEFDFKKYLSFHLIHHQAFLRSNDWRLVQKASSNSISIIANDCRRYLINILRQKGITGKELAVSSALILGYKNGIDEQLKKAYSSAGAMHVLAVSGLHVGIIFLIFNQLISFFEKFKYGKIIKGIILIIILWSYALLTGLSPSIMRAATMFSVIVIAKMTDRHSNIFNTLAASALMLLTCNPLLIMEVGFQLSYMAVIGIIIIQPWVNNWIDFRQWIPRKIWEITAVSIAAQIATFPLSLLYFHQFPNYFMLSNLIVIPLAIIILYLGIITLCFSVIPMLGDILAFTLRYVVKFLNYSVHYIDALPYSLWENIRFSVLDTWLIYLFIICIVALIAYRKFSFLLLAGSCLIIFLISTCWISYTQLNQRKLIVYNIPTHSAINFIDGSDNIFISDASLVKNRKKLLFHVQNNWINSGVNEEKIVQLDCLMQNQKTSDVYQKYNPNLFSKKNYFQFYNSKIAIVDNNFNYKNISKLAIDLLILTKNTKLSMNKILAIFNTKEIIIDSSNSFSNSKRLKKEAANYKIKCWSVLLDGAYTKNL